MARGGRLEREDTARLTPTEGRKFGLTVGAAFLVLGGISYWRGHRIPVFVLGGLGLLLVLGGLVVPGRLGPVERAWMGLAKAISRVTTPIFMAVVYFLVLTPAGVIVRWVGHDPLLHEAEEGSYWRSRSMSEGKSDLTRQF